MPQTMKTHLWLSLTVFFLPTTLHARESVSDIYAVVEVGSSGIKGQVLQMIAEDPESPPFKLLKLFEPVNENAFTWEAAASGKISAAVAQLHKEIQEQFQLPANHFFIVGSSGIPADVRQILSDKILEEVEEKIEYATPEKESDLLFRGIVPFHRLTQVVVLDIGSGDSRGAYVDKLRPDLSFTNFEIPWGTKTCAGEINKLRRDGDFRVAADAFRLDILVPAVKGQIQRAPGMQTSRRVYLVGGIAWAMATLLHPYDQEGSWVKFYPGDINTFCEKATTSPNLLLHPDLTNPPPVVPKNNVAKANEELTKIVKVFSDDQLMAGALILKTFMDEMHFDEKDAIFFRRDALYAWPRGYILEKIPANRAPK
jgi:hypothetical protein